MKIVFTALIITLLLFTSCANKNVPTDIKEYGLKGKIKSIMTINYSDLNNENGEWVVTDNKIVSKIKMTFNKDGNIVEVKEWLPTYNKEEFIEFTTKIIFNQGLKYKYLKTNSNGEIVESGNYLWKDNYNYKLRVNRKDEGHVDSFSELDESYRDLKGQYTYYREDGTVFLSESYENELNKDKEITSVKYKDLLNNTFYTVEFFIKNRDLRGNIVKATQVYKDSQTLKSFSIREIKYY